LAHRCMELAGTARLRCRHPIRRAARRIGASAGHRAHSGLGADQPAARHRRPPVLSPEPRDLAGRHRFPQSRRPSADHRARRHLHQLLAAARLHRRSARRQRALPLPIADIPRHGDPRRGPGSRDHGPHGRRSAAHLSHHLRDRRWPCRPRRVPPAPAIRRAPVHRPHLRPDHLHDLRVGRARQYDRRLRRRLHHQPDHRHQWLLRLYRGILRPGFRRVHRADLDPTARDSRQMSSRPLALVAFVLILPLLPLLLPEYFLHIAVQILLWGFIYTAWSMMGRYGLVSLGHGAFLGIGGYGPALLWNLYGVTPWLGVPVSVALAALLALLVGYPATRMRVVGHYYALVTLALSQVVALTIIALRDITGGSLGMTPRAVGFSWYALQFPSKTQFYFLALAVWLAGLAVWVWVDRGMGSKV